MSAKTLKAFHLDMSLSSGAVLLFSDIISDWYDSTRQMEILSKMFLSMNIGCSHFSFCKIIFGNIFCDDGVTSNLFPCL